MPTKGQTHLDHAHTGIPVHVVGALQDMRSAARGLIDAMPVKLARPAHLASELAISRTLAWRVWRLAEVEGELPGPSAIPGKAGFGAFLRAAEARGVAKEAIERAERALDRLQDAMRTHAGDKSGSDILLASLTGAGDDSQVLALRREAFRGHGYMLGVRARSSYMMFIPFIVQNAAGERSISAATVSGFYGVQRSRPDTRFLLSWTRTTRDFQKIPSLRFEPLAAASEGVHAEGRSPLMDEFCSKPTADLRRFTRPNRLGGESYEDELFPGQVGLTGASDIVLGQVLRGIPLSAEDRDDQLMRRIETPTELYTIDLTLPAELHDGRMPNFTFYMNVHEEASYLRDDTRDAVPVPERLRHVGQAGKTEPAEDVPRHASLVQRAFELIGRDPSEFEVYRLQLRYPPVPSTPIIRWNRPVTR